jgi:hypothetical protein
MSIIPSTSKALVLLNTILFRIAFLSPGIGGFPVLTNAFFLIFNVVPARTCTTGFLPPGPLAFATAERGADVEKEATLGRRAATLSVKGDAKCVEGRERHFQQLDDAIAEAAMMCRALPVTELEGLRYETMLVQEIEFRR